MTRAGTTTTFWWGASITPKQANYDGSLDPYTGGGSKGEYQKQTMPVDSFEPNPWGLYQVHGNVWEWTQDCGGGDNYSSNPGDGSPLTIRGCDYRVLRGGSWQGEPRFLRAAVRDANSVVTRYNYIGFRVARTLTP